LNFLLFFVRFTLLCTMGEMGDGGYRFPPGLPGWGERVVEWWTVRAKMLCVAFYIWV
jgi:hypothetical protein